MIHKNRGNRRWMNKRKRKHKYNLAKKICNKIKGVLGKYDKGHIYDLNDKLTPSEHEYGYKDPISNSDKKKVECCNDKVKDYEDGWAEIDSMIIADCEDYDMENNDEHIKMCEKCECEPYSKYINANSNEKEE